MGVQQDLGAATNLTQSRHVDAVWKVVAALALLALYLFSSPFEGRGGVSDVDAATLPAWHFAQTGSFEMSDYLGRSDWYVATDRGTFSNRSPGVIGFATVAYLVAAPFTPDYSPTPGVLLAVLASWLAVLFVAATADRLRPGVWLPALVLFGLGTPTWAVSSNQLWPHGPAQLGVAAAVWLLVQGREWGAGASFAAAVLIRPPTAVLALGVAAVKARQERSWSPLLRIGGPGVVAAVVFLTYGRIVFGSWSPVASYEAVGGFYGFTDAADRALNVLEAFALPRTGVLIWSSWIVVCLLFAYGKESEQLPSWLKMTPLVAGAYVVIHSLMEVASGALPYNYRYPLEAITLAAPLSLTAIPTILKNFAPRMALVASGGLAVFLQGAFVFVSACWLDAAEGVRVCRIFG